MTFRLLLESITFEVHNCFTSEKWGSADICSI
jgi:hypothetical protein